jgi:hypothetical protein
MANAVSKVGGLKGATATNAAKAPAGATNAPAEKQKKPRGMQPKAPYNFKDAKIYDTDGNSSPILNEQGKLLALPREFKDSDGKLIQEGFNFKKHKPLSKEEFADEPLFLLYKAENLEWRSNRGLKQAANLRKNAELWKTQGDPVKRKKLSKIQKMREAMAKLEAELEAEGVDMSDFRSKADSAEAELTAAE